MLILIMKNMTNNIMYILQEVHTCLWSFRVALWIISFLLIFSLHFLADLLINSFRHLQFLLSKYCLMSHDLSHSHSHILGFQISSLSHLPLSINSLHQHLRFQYSNVVHLQVSCCFIYLVSLLLDIRLHTLISMF